MTKGAADGLEPYGRLEPLHRRQHRSVFVLFVLDVIRVGTGEPAERIEPRLFQDLVQTLQPGAQCRRSSVSVP